jgi:oxygen-independent coproporphyrinogen III oxidase
MNADKYNKPVPRYTSYPPANHFTGNFTGHDYLDLIHRSNNEKPGHIAFYIHIPFCRQMCFYCGCNSCKLRSDKQVRDYIRAVRSEILKVSDLLDKSRKVSQVHFGGGTPNAIESRYIKEVLSLISDQFDFIDGPEIAIECNPAYLDHKYLHALKEAKINRFSLGIQDFNLQVLKTVNRLPSAMPVKEIIDIIRTDSASSVNLDFIYGLPLQTIESFAETIKEAISLKPDRLVTFSYAHVPWIMKNQRILEKRGLPKAMEKMAMFNKASGLLREAGYIPVGLDHYVLPGDELNLAQQNNMLHRNFQGYCTLRTTGQVYAFGVSAISQLAGGYAQNTKDIGQYILRTGNSEFPVEKGYRLSRREMVIREMITRLMCNYRLDIGRLAMEMNENTEGILGLIDKRQLEDFEGDGLIEFYGNRVRVREKGKLFIRTIASAFDPEYKPEENKYSKPV